MEEYNNYITFRPEIQINGKSAEDIEEVRSFEGRDISCFTGSDKTKDYLNNNNNIFETHKSVSELIEMRSEKRELKARISELKSREKTISKKIITKINNLFKSNYSSTPLQKSKLEIAQKEYETMRSALHEAVKSNPAACRAKEVRNFIKKTNKLLSKAGNKWENIGVEFRNEFDIKSKNVKLFGNLKSFLGPKTNSSRANIDTFIDDIASGLEHLQAVQALHKHDIQWLHGTRSPALGVMLATDKRLYPTGHLLEHKIYPLTGELLDGISGEGINREYLSGTASSKLGIKTTMEYASSFKTSQSTVWGKLSEKKLDFLCKRAVSTIKEDPELKGNFGQGIKLEFLRTRIFLERAKVIDSDFASHSESFLKVLDAIKEKYSKNCPKTVSDWIQNLKDNCFTPPFIQPTGEIRELVNDSFPIVLGLISEKGKPVEGGAFLDEFIIKGEIPLDKMAIAFTDKENVERLKGLFKKADLNIEVVDFNALKALAIDAPDSIHPEEQT